MEPFAWIAALSSAALIVLVIAVLLVGLWLPARRDDAVPLEQVLRRQGDRVAARALMRRDYAAALRRCDTCSQAVQCRGWIATQARDGYEYFCPNVGFVERMKRVL